LFFYFVCLQSPSLFADAFVTKESKRSALPFHSALHQQKLLSFGRRCSVSDDSIDGGDDGIINEQTFGPAKEVLDGDNLTDRFKYKVHALMGNFDPPVAEQDNERENGNILNAMLKFPVDYTFNIVGRTDGRVEQQELFVQQVKDCVLKGSGEVDLDAFIVKVTPRGENFTKVSVDFNVDSAAIIASIYEEFEKLDMVVMQF